MTLQLSQAVMYHRTLSPDLWLELENQGFPAAVIHSRLIGWDGEHVTIPVFSRDRKLRCFEYAALDDDGRLVPVVQERQHSSLYGEPILETLFPGLAAESQEETRLALRRYLSFIVRLHARINSDPRERERLAALTRKVQVRSMEHGRSFTSQTPDTDV